MTSLEGNLGYEFNDKHLLDRALTRKAFANEQKQKGIVCSDQEVLRTLGDAVLKAILVDYLIDSGAATREEITIKKMRMEDEGSLSDVGKKLGIDSCIKLGAGEQKQGANKTKKVVAESLEAVIGAIYLDGGYDEAKRAVKEWLNSGLFGLTNEIA